MRGPPHVVHLVPALFGAEGIVGGAERYVLGLARCMAARTPTTLVTFGERPREETDGALRVRVLGPSWHIRGQRSNALAPSLLGALRHADVVHCHQQHVLASSLTALMGLVTNRPVFVTDLGGGGWDVSAYIPTDRWYAGHLHISEYSRRCAGHDGAPWARVILGGVDTNVFSPIAGLPRDEPVLFVGRLLPHKGVDDLIRATDEHLAVDLVGPAPDARYVADLRALAGSKAVRFRHEVDDGSLVEAYRRTPCVVLPSVYRTMYGTETAVPELLGQTLLEAMACGTPVIATDVASLPEVVADGITGFVVPPNDPASLGAAIRQVLGDSALARRLGAAGRERVLRHFTWDGVVTRCLDTYASARPTA